MSFLATHLAGGLLRPGTMLVVCATLGLLLARWRVGRMLLCAGVIGLALIVLLPVQLWALAPLEDRFPQTAYPDHVDGVIVLGGALDTEIAAGRGIPSLNAAAERMTEWIALARRYPAARMVFTGGIGTPLIDVPSEAEVTRALVARLGLDVGRFEYEGRSRTTYENAVLSRELVRPQAGQTWLLVTSASHMPRAIGVFRRIGWSVVAWPVGYKTTHTLGPEMLEPFSDKLIDLDVAAHEWFGLATYALTGKSSSVFPAP